ncbi:hypothetical protein QCA50_003538 [Cerrena zonata]|uniref:NAD(P)-binding protein n=1 Tax=Cerrena zonata TaxID=2478898 RepID=A0AAW0GU58_9APHY
MAPRVWFITGTSTGIGRYMAELLLKKGEIVVATARKPEVLADLKAHYPSTQLLILQLDVNKLQDIKTTLTSAKNAFGRIDVVFNNAGYAVVGDIEATPEDEARTQFDTNFWGAANVSREAVRFFREENKPSGGLLITNTSLTGIVGVPGFGYYAASKHALEGFTKTLAAELDPAWNIKVSIVVLGSFYTSAITKIGTGFAHPAYTKPDLPSVAMRALLNSSQRLGADAAKAVERIYEFSLDAEPSLHFPLGQDAVAGIKNEIKRLGEDVGRHEVRSEGLGFDV